MPADKDPTRALRTAAAALPMTVEGASCNQTSYKAGGKAFLYVGPGAKGVGYKTMFKLDASMAQARALAKSEPDRFEVGAGNWVTARFTADNPLAKSIWSSWLKESYAAAHSSGDARKSSASRKRAR